MTTIYNALPVELKNIVDEYYNQYKDEFNNTIHLLNEYREIIDTIEEHNKNNNIRHQWEYNKSIIDYDKNKCINVAPVATLFHRKYLYNVIYNILKNKIEEIKNIICEDKRFDILYDRYDLYAPNEYGYINIDLLTNDLLEICLYEKYIINNIIYKNDKRNTIKNIKKGYATKKEEIKNLKIKKILYNSFFYYICSIVITEELDLYKNENIGEIQTNIFNIDKFFTLKKYEYE